MPLIFYQFIIKWALLEFELGIEIGKAHLLIDLSSSVISECKLLLMPFIDNLAGSSIKGQINFRHLSNRSRIFNLRDTSSAESPFSRDNRARPR